MQSNISWPIDTYFDRLEQNSLFRGPQSDCHALLPRECGEHLLLANELLVLLQGGGVLCNVALTDADHGGQHPPLERRRDRLVEVHSIKRLSPVQQIRTHIHTYIGQRVRKRRVHGITVQHLHA